MKSYGILLALCFISLGIAGAQINDKIINRKVDRTIDLNSQLARHTLKITMVNQGSKPVSEFHLTFQDKLASHLSFIEIKDNSGATLTVTKGGHVEKNSQGFVVYSVATSRPFETSASLEVTATLVFSHVMTPFPVSIAQNEKQKVIYTDNHFFFSPYTTGTQTTTVKLASSNIESKTEQAPTSLKGDSIVYGPYEDTAAYHHSAMRLHFENNKHFITVTRMVKYIEISHWGNVAVEEEYLMQNDGAALKGTFSRFDYQRNPGGTPSSVAGFTHLLPAGAADVYYRDEIGNISTSHVSSIPRAVKLELIPRFPMFGGWKTGFYIGYNLPLFHALFASSDRFVLNTPFATNFEEAAIDELEVRVILPEGAKEIEVFTPFPVDSITTDQLHFTYLDISGRPVVVIKTQNIITDHNRNFQVVYQFGVLSMFQEPMILVVAILTFLLFVMGYVRLEFSIGPVKQKAANSDKVENILSKLKDYVEERNAHHVSLDATLDKHASDKNLQQYTSERRKIEADINSISKEALKLQSELEDLEASVAKKVNDLEKKEKRKTEAHLLVHDNELSFRKKEKTKESYEAAKSTLQKAFDSAEFEVEDLAGELFAGL